MPSVGYLFGSRSCHCCCDDCCIAFDGRSFCSPGEDGTDAWVLVSGSGLYGTEGAGYWTRDTGTEHYRFDIRWFPQSGLCGKPRFVAKARVDEIGGAWQEVEWGTYDLNPGDPGFEYGGESSGRCPTGLTEYGEPTETMSDPAPVAVVYGIESVSFCCGCANVPHCWRIDWDFEFLQGDDTWVQNTGYAIVYIAPSRNCDDPVPDFTRLKCRNGTAVDESVNDFPNDPVSTRYLLGANTNEFGNTDTVELDGVIGDVCGETELILWNDYIDFEWSYAMDGVYREYEDPGEFEPRPGVVVRGSATLTNISPSSEAGCGCP